MNAKTLLLLASLAVLATSAGAAESQPNVIVLPTLVVNAPRYEPAEQKVNASLEALRRQAQAPVYLATELPLFKDQAAPEAAMAKAAQEARTPRFAKL